MKRLILRQDVAEMLKDDLPDSPSVGATQIVRKGFLDVKRVRVQPILALDITLPRMDMRRFIPFIEVKEQSPSANVQDGRHGCSLTLLDDSACPHHSVKPTTETESPARDP
jgi:hypothetical protein